MLLARSGFKEKKSAAALPWEVTTADLLKLETETISAGNWP
jgi:hypothetical protein